MAASFPRVTVLIFLEIVSIASPVMTFNQPYLSSSCSDEKQSNVLESDVICVEYDMTSMLSYTRDVNE